ncbi:hypothetical protein FPQ18DRAFT_357640 [Pyronema domesticum]|nr:hypothetical protein FPQ18DRAFT_357640 [Pyronema domesticum]
MVLSVSSLWFMVLSVSSLWFGWLYAHMVGETLITVAVMRARLSPFAGHSLSSVFFFHASSMLPSPSWAPPLGLDDPSLQRLIAALGNLFSSRPRFRLCFVRVNRRWCVYFYSICCIRSEIGEMTIAHFVHSFFQS